MVGPTELESVTSIVSRYEYQLLAGSALVFSVTCRNLIWTLIGRQEAFVVGERVQDAIVTVFCFLSSMIFLPMRRRLALASLS
jgi:hypothetical protein